MGLAVFAVLYVLISVNEVGFVFSLRGSSAWEAQMRAREANEFFSQKETEG